MLLSNFSNRATNKLVVKFQKVLIFSRNTLKNFFISYVMKETNGQNKHMLLLFLKQKFSLVEKGHSGHNLAPKTADPYNFKLALDIFEQFCTVREGKG